MRDTQNKYSKVKKCLFFLVVILLPAVMYQACTKLDIREATPESPTEITSKFFEIPNGTNEITKRVLADLEKQNNAEEFVTTFATTKGYPVWNKAQISVRKPVISTSFGYNSLEGSGQPDTIVIIPIVLQNTNLVNGYVKATINDSISTLLFNRNGYTNYPYAANGGNTDSTAEEYMLQMMLLDNAVFGDTLFKVIDSNLFKNTPLDTGTHPTNHYISLHQITVTPNLLIEAQICISSLNFYICTVCGLESCPYSHYYTWESCIPAGGGGGGATIGNNNGSGNNNTPNGGGSNNSGVVPTTPPVPVPPNICDSVNAIA